MAKWGYDFIFSLLSAVLIGERCCIISTYKVKSIQFNGHPQRNGKWPLSGGWSFNRSKNNSKNNLKSRLLATHFFNCRQSCNILV